MIYKGILMIFHSIIKQDHIEAKSPKIDQEADCYFAHLYHQISLTLGVWCRKKMHAEISFGPPKSVTRFKLDDK